MAFLAPLAPYAAAAALPLAGAIGGEVGSIASKGLRALRSKLGFRKGGSLAPKAMIKALHRATVKKTGTRIVKNNMVVFPKGLGKKMKQVAKRKPTAMKKKRKARKNNLIIIYK